MKLHYITSILLIIHLYGYSLALDLPKLHDNKLAEGKDRELPNAEPIHCESVPSKKYKVSSTKKVDQILTNTIFGQDAITAGAIVSPGSPKPGREAKFKFAVVKGEKVMYVLVVDESGTEAYWLPQGGTIDIPHHPSAGQPKYVFTPDFSGCSWTVTPMVNGMLRIRHVGGGHESSFNHLSEAEKGGPITYALQYKDYGFHGQPPHRVSHVPASTFMHYSESGKHWILGSQSKPNCHTAGGFSFDKKHKLKELYLHEPKSTYPAVSDVKYYNIP